MFNILVVDDNKNTRKLMEAVLRTHGYLPFLAEDGEKALDVLDKQHPVQSAVLRWLRV